MKLLLQIVKARKWNDEEQLVLDQVHRMANETIAPNAEHADESGAFPWENVKAINELGLSGSITWRSWLTAVRRISDSRPLSPN